MQNMPSKHKQTRRPASIRAQTTLGISLILILVLLIAFISYQSLQSLARIAGVNLEQANQFRELSLRLENEFLAARQNEAALLASHGSMDYTTMYAYVSNSQSHLGQARTELGQMNDLAQMAQDPQLRGLLDQVSQLEQQIVAYERAFIQTSRAIQTRGQASNLETILREEMEQLVSSVAPLSNEQFRQLLSQIRTEEQTYLNTGEQTNADNLRTLTGVFDNLVNTSTTTDLTVGGVTLDRATLIEHSSRYLAAFNQIVKLDQEIKTASADFQEIATDIDTIKAKIDETSQAGLNHAREQFQAIAYQTAIALGVGAAATLGVGILLWVILTRRIVSPLTELSQAAQQIGLGNLAQTVDARGSLEAVTVSEAFNLMVQQLKQTLAGLEQQVADRTRDLEQRSAYLSAAAEVGRVASTILDTDQLVQQAVQLIREQFNLYYVGLFMADETKEWAVLRAGTGEAGHKMLARGHRHKIGAGSMIGWSIENAQARIALEAEADAERRATSELPDTRSEAALPLRSRGQVIGALTVQSVHYNAFDTASISILQTMADQIAVALDNARLLAESQIALEAVQRAYGEIGRQAWSQLLSAQRDLIFRSDPHGSTKAVQAWQPEMVQALQQGQIVYTQDDTANKRSVTIPIKVSGATIGALNTHKPDTAGDWTSEELLLLEQVADQLAQALESARLYEDTQRRAAREQLTGEITARLRASLDIERVLQTAVRELGEASGAIRVDVQLGTDKD